MSEEKYVTVVTIEVDSLDVLNVLLNAAIVSAAVHRAHKFTSVAHSPFTSHPSLIPATLLVRSVDSSVRRTRARATLVPNEIYMYIRKRDPTRPPPFVRSPVIGIRVFKSLFYQGRKNHISRRTRGGIHMLRRFG